MTLTKTIKVSTTVHGEFIAVYYGTLTWLSATGLQLRDSKNHTDARFVRSLNKNSYICADGYNAISHTKDERMNSIKFSMFLTYKMVLFSVC
jgi:hypothetical protein